MDDAFLQAIIENPHDASTSNSKRRGSATDNATVTFPAIVQPTVRGWHYCKFCSFIQFIEV
jgi:hypothetical protein